MQEEHESSTSASELEWAAPFALDEDALEAVNREALSTTSNHSRLDAESRSIRLLTITWNQDLGEVECRTETCSLDDVPLYTALSYTWGRPDAACKIMLDGSKIAVTKNLRRFLCHAVRLPKYGSRRYWIDALCIDQSNLEERRHQVALMSIIYSAAAAVVVWLGPAYSPWDTAIKAVRKPYKPETWLSRRGGDVRSLCERAYWSRLWVVQELCLAKDIHLLCGHEDVSWSSFVKYITNAKSNRPRLKATQGASIDYEAFCQSLAIAMVENVQHAKRSAALMDQMSAFRQLQCVDPRDRVYALLGISQHVEDITADYTLPIVTLLHNVLRAHHKAVQPTSLKEVEEQCSLLCLALNLRRNQMLDVIDTKDHHRDMTVFGKDCDAGRFAMLKWASTHSHDCVLHLWHREIMERNNVELLFDKFITHGKEALVRMSIEHGLIRPNASHLHEAIRFHHNGIARVLSQCESVDVNVQDRNGFSPLLSAASSAYNICASFNLEDTRFDVNKEGPRTYDPLSKRWIGTQSPLHAAIWYGEQGMADRLLDHPEIDVDCKDDRGCTPLQAAICKRFARMVKRLLQDERVSLKGQCFFGCTGHGRACAAVPRPDDAGKLCSTCTYLPSPLCAAIELHTDGLRSFSDQRDIVEALLTRADLNVDEGEPLRRAINRGLVEIVEMLLRREDLSLVSTIFSADGAVYRYGTMVFTLKYYFRHDERDMNILRLLLESGKPIDLSGEVRAAKKLRLNEHWEEAFELLQEHEKRRRTVTDEMRPLQRKVRNA